MPKKAKMTQKPVSAVSPEETCKLRGTQSSTGIT